MSDELLQRIKALEARVTALEQRKAKRKSGAKDIDLGDCLAPISELPTAKPQESGSEGTEPQYIQGEINLRDYILDGPGSDL